MFLEKYSQYAIPLISAAVLVFNNIRLFTYAEPHSDSIENEINIRSPLLAYFLVLAATLLVVAEIISYFKLFANHHAVCEYILQFFFGMFVFEFVTQFFWNPIELFIYHTLPKTVEKLARGEECLFNFICSNDCTPYTLILYTVSLFLFFCSLKCSINSPENSSIYNCGSTANNYSSTNNLNLSPPLPSILDQEKSTRMCDISQTKQKRNKSPSCKLTSCQSKSIGQKSKKKNNNTKKNTTNMIRSRHTSPRKRCMHCIYKT